MIAIQATAQTFWTAFRSLSRRHRHAVVEKLVQDREFREDLVDLMLLEQRRKEPSRPLEAYLADRRRKRQ